METLLLIPVDDSVVFPNMTVTLAIDVGDAERGRAGPAQGRRVRQRGHRRQRGRAACACPVAAVPWRSRASTAPASAPPARTRAARCAWRSTRIPTTCPSTGAPATWSASTARWSRRSSTCAATTAAWPRSSAPSPSPARWPIPSGYSPDLTYDQKIEVLETLDVTERLELSLKLQRERLAELQVRTRIRDDVQSGAEKQQREYFLRKQMESIRKELGDDDASVVGGVPRQDRGSRHARRRARAGRARAGPARAHGRAGRRGLDDPVLPGLADRGAVVRALRRAARSRARARGAGRRPRRASRTSRTASSSTSPCASCARSAASRRTSARAPSSR